MKVFKNITLTLLISSALACGVLAQTGNQLAPNPNKDRKKDPERPIEKRKNENRGGSGRVEKKDKKPDGIGFWLGLS
jgi:hypothetical protein